MKLTLKSTFKLAHFTKQNGQEKSSVTARYKANKIQNVISNKNDEKNVIYFHMFSDYLKLPSVLCSLLL